MTRVETVETGEGETADITPAGIGAARGLSPERLRRRLRGDLDVIVMMALRKQPNRRYASAQMLSDDVGRYLVRRAALGDHDPRVHQTMVALGGMLIHRGALVESERTYREALRLQTEALAERHPVCAGNVAASRERCTGTAGSRKQSQHTGRRSN